MYIYLNNRQENFENIPIIHFTRIELLTVLNDEDWGLNVHNCHIGCVNFPAGNFI